MTVPVPRASKVTVVADVPATPTVKVPVVWEAASVTDAAPPVPRPVTDQFAVPASVVVPVVNAAAATLADEAALAVTVFVAVPVGEKAKDPVEVLVTADVFPGAAVTAKFDVPLRVKGLAAWAATVTSPPVPVPALVVAPMPALTVIAAEGVMFRVLTPVKLIVSIALKPADVPATAVATNVIVPASVTLRTSVVPAPPVKVEPRA